MHRLSILIILCLLATVNTLSARNISQFFVMSESDDAVRLVDRNGRLDMVDYFISNMPHTTRNVLKGEARLVYADSLRMEMTLDEDVHLQLSLAVDGRDTTIVAIRTLNAPQADSEVMMYDVKWRPRTSAAIKLPGLEQWLTDLGKEERDKVEATLPFLLTTARYDPATRILTFTDNTAQYFVDGEERAAVARWLHPQLQYRLKGSKFQVVK